MRLLFRMFLRLLKISFVCGLLYFISSCSFDAGRNYAGYCLTEGRRLSDDEMIRRAIEYIEKRPSVTFLEGDGSTAKLRSYSYVPYKNTDEFLAENPNCCTFGFNALMSESDGAYPPPEDLNRLTGNYAGNVKMTYKGTYSDDKKQLKQFSRTEYILMYNCGKPYEIGDY